MGSNYIPEDASINPSIQCVNDSVIGYSANFSNNGEVDGWDYFDNIHTYGCWDGFLFGTLYGSYGTIGRTTVFLPVDATTHYFIRIVMKYNPVERVNHPLPTQGKIRWRTLSSTNWGASKELFFDIEPDNEWRTYIINAGVEQWWQGSVNDMRIWPAVDHGEDGDEFFIRAIEVFSSDAHQCRNTQCSKYTEYSYPCPWIGKRATCESVAHEDGKLFNIDNLSEFIISINEYGNEITKVKEVANGSGREVANALARAISRTNIGGYSEVEVEYTDDNTFKIYSGTIHADSSVEVIDNTLSRYLGFFDALGNNISTRTDGETPVNGYSPLSSFKIKTHQALGLLDNNEKTALTFNPFQYSIEGGRRDWLTSSIGLMSAAIGENSGDRSSQVVRKYFAILNDGKTIIDYNHPFNASGRIKKIWVGCTLDDPTYTKTERESSRKSLELSAAKVLIVRPKRNGEIEVIYEWDLNDRDPNRTTGDALYSLTQESIDLDVDVFVNKGDMIAVYNANMYVGKSVSGNEYDCQYYQLNDKPEVGEVFEPGRLYGDGSGGLLVYAHGDETQQRLYLNIDLGERYNINTVDIRGEALNSILEYNIARCLDINWQCELFGEYHWTAHTRFDLGGTFKYQRYNVAYGIDNLNDGVYNVPDGLACDSFSLTNDASSNGVTYNAGPGVVPTNPYYFWINGDEEWLAVWLHANPSVHKDQEVYEFDSDPVALYITFPNGKEKKIYKSKIYFKEKFNFRNMALSTYGGFYYTLGDADDYHYDLIPEYTKIVLDNVEYYDGSPTYNMVKDYLFENPCSAKMEASATSSIIYEWDPIYSDFAGFFTYQDFEVDNAAEWSAARKVDWQIIEHQWEPISAKGFRIFTDFHKSTKITEMELYGVADDIGSNLAGGITLTHSDYEELWWPTESSQVSTDLVEIHVGDSPRYINLEITPVTETRYDDIVINIKTDDIYAGVKGCEYVYYANSAKTNSQNAGQLISVKNTYGAPYDLYIDIAPSKLIEEGLVYYSNLNSNTSIENPLIGPDANYYKLYDYPLLNQDSNCAINCDVYGLKNLIDGRPAYYSYNNGLTWHDYGDLAAGEYIDFFNVNSIQRSVLTLPIISRNRYWKFYFPNYSMNIRELETYLEGERLYPSFYNDDALPELSGPISYPAPHLSNDSIVGSYYVMDVDSNIGIDLGSQSNIDKMVFYHDSFSCNRFLMDEYIRLYLTEGDLLDHSYEKQPMTAVGNVSIDPTTIKLSKPCIRFEDAASYLTCPHNDFFNFNHIPWSVDCFVMFEEIPPTGTAAEIIRKWGGGSNSFIVRYYNGQLQIYINGSLSRAGTWNPTVGVWDHVAVAFGGGGRPATFSDLYVNGVSVSSVSSSNSPISYGTEPIQVGVGLRGWISHLRQSSGNNNSCGSKADALSSGAYFTVPTAAAKPKFSVQVYSSYDNITYGLYANTDIYADTVDNVFTEGTEFNTLYYNYFAIDLEQRYSLGMIRTYGMSDAFSLTEASSEITYSNNEVADVEDAVFDSTINDVRWLKIQFIAGDTTSRKIRKLGVYPNIENNINPAVAAYNCEWENLGPSITAFSNQNNAALDAVVSGSSYIGAYDPSNLTNGIINNDITQAWLSDNSSEQWVTIDLETEKEIYRVKIYHGYSEEDDDFIVQSYTIDSSTDAQTYTNRWTITGNSSFERTHDLTEPFTARYIRMYITGYKANSTINIKGEDGVNYYSWHGACIREIEVYEYYGYTYISSEEWPIIAINLRDQFYIDSHELVGLDAESTTTDWDNSDSNFAWSDDVNSNPNKIRFNSWGSTPNYEQWVSIKRNTATELGGGTDYLKHALVTTITQENPFNYPWWWSSTVSTLSRDYSMPVEISVGSLKISYPDSVALDTVQFIEGSNWGIDSDIAYRDGLSFRWYIDDIDKLDYEDGYVFFGGLDTTNSPRPVEYRWYLTSLSGVLQTGWNRPYFRLRTADELIYNEDADPFSDNRPEMPEYTQWQTFGIKFKGKGQAFTMNLDGALIQRNYFQDSSKFDYGLYLAGDDYLECPLSEIDLKAGTIEFWMRPDYTFAGMDIFRRLKNRSLFHMGNVANDVFGMLVNSSGVNIYYGNVAVDLRALVIAGIQAGGIDSLIHVAVVYSANGKNLGGGATIKFYINNVLVATGHDSWSYSDEKLFKFTVGGKAPLGMIEHSSSLETTSIDSVISNLRIYNYCKTDFTDSLNNSFSSNTSDLIVPSKMVEISQDNVTYYKVGDPELPFFYEKVPAGNTVQVYVRTVIPDGLTGKEDRTAGIVTIWDIGV